MSFTLDRNSWPCQRAINNKWRGEKQSQASTTKQLANSIYHKKLRIEVGGGGVTGGDSHQRSSHSSEKVTSDRLEVQNVSSVLSCQES